MTTAHATSTIAGALARTLIGLSAVEACSVGQGVFGAPVSAAEEARELARRRGEDDAVVDAGPLRCLRHHENGESRKRSSRSRDPW